MVDPDTGDDACFVTEEANYPYLRVDMGETKVITRVDITACILEEDVITGYVVSASNEPTPPSEDSDVLNTCGSHSATMESGETAVVACNEDTTGRYVFIYLERTDKLKINRLRIYVSNPGKSIDVVTYVYSESKWTKTKTLMKRVSGLYFKIQKEQR